MSGVTTKRLLAQAERAGKSPRMIDRDSQRAKLYRAERVALTKHTKPLTRAQVDKLLERIVTSSYVVRNYGSVKHRVRYLNYYRGTATAGWNGEIVLPPWGLNTMTVIHEVSHLYTMHLEAGHDWLFCAVYLDLVRKFMGKEAHADLKATFKAHKVKHTAPRPRKAMTAEQRAAASERMVKARAAKGNASTGEYVVMAKLAGWNNWAIVRAIGRNLRITYYPDRAVMRKTEPAAAKMLTAAKHRTWSDAKLILIDRNLIELDGDRRMVKGFDPETALLSQAARR